MEAGAGATLTSSPLRAAAREEISIDAALQSTVGEFGRGQQLFYGMAQLIWLPAALLTLLMVFTNLDPLGQGWYLCVPGHEQAELCASALNTTDTGEASLLFCQLSEEAWEWTRRADSIVSEWNLVCGEAWKQQAVNTGFFFGFLLGAGFFGWLSDYAGRKKAIIASGAAAGCAGMLCGTAGGYWTFFLFRAVTGFGVGGIGMAGYVLGCEFVGPSWRGLLGVAAQYFFAAGCMILPILAYKVPNWRMLSLLSGGSVLLYLMMMPYIPESPRWQLIQGRKGEATATLAAIASYNRTRMPDLPLADVVVTSGTGAGMGDVLAHPVLRGRFAVQIFAWFSVCCTYYGISLMTADLPGSVYTTNAMMAAVEVAAYLVSSLLVDRIGRRWTIAGAYLLAGTSLILSAITAGPARLWLALAAKCGAAAAFALILLYAAELFPTVVRSACIGACSQAARLGGMATPVIIMIAQAMHFPLLAFLVLGISSTAAGLLLLTQPETLGEVLPETLNDVGAPPRAQELKPWRRGSGEGMEEGGAPLTSSPSYFAGFMRGRGFMRVKEGEPL